MNDFSQYVPVILDKKKISGLAKKGVQIIDNLADQAKELAQVTGRRAKPASLWVYYPWRNCVVHVLNQKDYYILRSSRNHNLITPAEQAKFNKVKVGFAGLNVGNPGAVCVALGSGANFMKMADFDELSVSNLNRFRAGLCELGLNKAVLTARQVHEINPFAQIKMFDEGIKPGREEDFLLKPKIDILVEEMDDLKLKITIRQKAKKHGIPVVMVTGNGSNLVLDVERYDLNKNLPILNGQLERKIQDRIMNKDLSKLRPSEKVLLARDFMGKNVLTKRLMDSFKLVGTKLAGIPQLSEASFLRGAVLCYAVRQIATGAKLKSGRYHVRLDNIAK